MPRNMIPDKRFIQPKTRQKIIITKKIKLNAEEMTKNRIEKVAELRHFTWQLKRAGFKDASGEAGVDIAFETTLHGKKVRITVDQKVSDGKKHGEGAIQTRIKNRELHNKADWVVVLRKHATIEAFPTEMLARFIKQQFGQLKFYQRRKNYELYSLQLQDLYKFMRQIMQTEPIRIGLSKDAGELLIKEMLKRKEAKSHARELAKKAQREEEIKQQRLQKQKTAFVPPVKKGSPKIVHIRPANSQPKIIQKRFDRRINPGRN